MSLMVTDQAMSISSELMKKVNPAKWEEIPLCLIKEIFIG